MSILLLFISLSFISILYLLTALIPVTNPDAIDSTYPSTPVICPAKYISTSNNNFQPMNANFGILPELPEKIKDKKAKYAKLADKAIESLKTTIKCYNNITK